MYFWFLCVACSDYLCSLEVQSLSKCYQRIEYQTLNRYFCVLFPQYSKCFESRTLAISLPLVCIPIILIIVNQCDSPNACSTSSNRNLYFWISFFGETFEWQNNISFSPGIFDDWFGAFQQIRMELYGLLENHFILGSLNIVNNSIIK